MQLSTTGEWGTVCADDFDDINAQVACRALGMSGGIAVKVAAFGQGAGKILMENVYCNGIESSLGQCDYLSQSDCTHSQDVGVVCDLPGGPALP